MFMYIDMGMYIYGMYVLCMWCIICILLYCNKVLFVMCFIKLSSDNLLRIIFLGYCRCRDIQEIFIPSLRVVLGILQNGCWKH